MGGLERHHLERALPAHRRAVARGQRGAVQLDPPAHHLQPRVPPVGQRVLHPLARLEARGVEIRVLVDGHAAAAPVAGGDQPQGAPLLRFRDRLLLVAGGEPAAVGQEPDLEEVHRLVALAVELAVGDAGPRAHALDVAGHDHRAGAHAVGVLERALQHVGHDLHVAVRVGAEALAGRDPVLVDDPERAEAHVGGVVVVGEREGVRGVEPAVVEVAALGGRTLHDHRIASRCEGDLMPS